MLEGSGDMGWIGVAAAAVLTGRDRTTIFRARKSGRLPIWTDGQGTEAVSLSDLLRLYPTASWPDASPEIIRRHLLAGEFRRPEGDIKETAPAPAALVQAIDRLVAEKSAAWRVLAWSGAVAMILVAASNFFVVAALARLAGLF